MPLCSSSPRERILCIVSSRCFAAASQATAASEFRHRTCHVHYPEYSCICISVCVTSSSVQPADNLQSSSKLARLKHQPELASAYPQPPARIKSYLLPHVSVELSRVGSSSAPSNLGTAWMELIQITCQRVSGPECSAKLSQFLEGPSGCSSHTGGEPCFCGSGQLLSFYNSFA